MATVLDPVKTNSVIPGSSIGQAYSRVSFYFRSYQRIMHVTWGHEYMFCLVFTEEIRIDVSESEKI